eukprot:gb/GFBE01062007.1/.p1 GENE.gb/GFBE01062007.1/~~gb/GFBE01062007.1/.p1  ORF type:complete len:303 (+),score=41.31 gb/GFBE01062007.1/:1-909(+)
MALRLEYRFSFIVAEEEKMVTVTPRAQSQPIRKQGAEGEGVQPHAGVNEYLTALVPRAEQLGMFARRSRSRRQVKVAADKSPGQQRTDTAETCSTVVPADATSSLRSQFSSLGSNMSSPTALGSSTDLIEQEELPSPGSLGHPEACRRPCMFAAVGQCTTGASCGFCHLPHFQRPFHMDKRTRELLQKLGQADLIELVTISLRARAQQLGIEAETSELISVMEHWLATARLTAASSRKKSNLGTSAKAMGTLDLQLRKMTLSALLGLALRSANAEQDSVFEECATRAADAMNRLRLQLTRMG